MGGKLEASQADPCCHLVRLGGLNGLDELQAAIGLHAEGIDRSVEGGYSGST